MPAQILPTIDNPVQDAAMFSQSMSNFVSTLARLNESKLELMLADGRLKNQTLQQQLMQANLQRTQMETDEFKATQNERIATITSSYQAGGAKNQLELLQTKLQADNATQTMQQELDHNTLVVKNLAMEGLKYNPKFIGVTQQLGAYSEEAAKLQSQMAIMPDGPLKESYGKTLGEIFNQIDDLSTEASSIAKSELSAYPSLSGGKAPRVSDELSAATQPSEEGQKAPPPTAEEPKTVYSSEPTGLVPKEIRAMLVSSGTLDSAGKRASTLSKLFGTQANDIYWTDKDILTDKSTGTLQVDLPKVAARMKGDGNVTDKDLANAGSMVSRELKQILQGELTMLLQSKTTPEALRSKFDEWIKYLGDNLSTKDLTELDGIVSKYEKSLVGKFSRRAK